MAKNPQAANMMKPPP